MAQEATVRFGYRLNQILSAVPPMIAYFSAVESAGR